MKSDDRYKLAYNRLLDLLASMPAGTSVPPEAALSAQLAVSRTTIKKALLRLEAIGAINSRDGTKTVGAPDPLDRFDDSETISPTTRAGETLWTGELQKGDVINASDLARSSGASLTSIRRALADLERIGLVETGVNGKWLFIGYNADFASEMFEVRELFEVSAALAFSRLPPNSPSWPVLKALREKHIQMLESLDQQYEGFPALDDEFHQLVYSAAPNRFVVEFQSLLAYLYRLDTPPVQLDVYRQGLADHIEYIDALISRDMTAATTIIRRHLTASADRVHARLAGRPLEAKPRHEND